MNSATNDDGGVWYSEYKRQLFTDNTAPNDDGDVERSIIMVVLSQ
jgi:hypothetical protein